MKGISRLLKVSAPSHTSSYNLKYSSSKGTAQMHWPALCTSTSEAVQLGTRRFIWPTVVKVFCRRTRNLPLRINKLLILITPINHIYMMIPYYYDSSTSSIVLLTADSAKAVCADPG